MKPRVQLSEGENDTEWRKLHEQCDSSGVTNQRPCEAGCFYRTETVADRGDRDRG